MPNDASRSASSQSSVPIAGHTPGPWRVDPGHNLDVQTADGREVATMLHESLIGQVAFFGGRCDFDSNEATANARLIAAAPELLEALAFYADETAWNQPPVKTREGLLGVEYENQASKVRWDRGRVARAAIAKARGQ